MCYYRPEDKELFKEFKRLEKLWKDRSAEIVEEMMRDGVDRVYSDNGVDYMKLVVMPPREVKAHTVDGYSYIRFYWEWRKIWD